jgi:hypothetical protein
MTNAQSIAIGLVLIAAAVFGLAGLAWLVLDYRRKRRLARPDWQRMLAETPYFRQSMQRIFRARGYEIIQWWEFRDPIERQVREVVFALRRRGQVYAALCGRWVIPITSEVITRFEQALATTQARAGLIVTTSFFSEAALARAKGLPVELHDSATLQGWIAEL